ncbi:uncharacterized protein A4U43_C05F700 [Asparagus officinalis]|uniref:Uncharacterized protein n=1 Tax=Asparagus officinalis TaxID=4686 RepID=A0A5P1ESG2_ASPOF|nr:uncharacterized protein A4U43_C05F700 [Asparagus officinalis]
MTRPSYSRRTFDPSASSPPRPQHYPNLHLDESLEEESRRLGQGDEQRHHGVSTWRAALPLGLRLGLEKVVRVSEKIEVLTVVCEVFSHWIERRLRSLDCGNVRVASLLCYLNRTIPFKS